MTPSDLQSLFQPHTRGPKFASVRDEIEAVAFGAKPMSVFLFPEPRIGSDPFFQELSQIASEVGLPTVTKPKECMIPDDCGRFSYLFIFRPEEQWRIPSYIHVKRVCEHYGWSDAAEHLEGRLLGYSDNEIKVWLQERARVWLGWNGKTFMLLVPSAVAHSVRHLGSRSINEDVVVAPLLVFFNRKQYPLRQSSYQRFSPAIEIARIAVREDFFRELFADASRTTTDDVIVAEVRRDMVPQLNCAAVSNIQFFGPNGWE